MGNSFRRSRKKTQDITEKKNPNKNKLQKQRQRIVSERLHLDAQGDSLDDINAINDAIDNGKWYSSMTLVRSRYLTKRHSSCKTQYFNKQIS